MTEPTDAELKAMWRLHAADIGGIFYYARAVLAKWGQPQAVACGEPVEAQQRFRHPQKTMPNWSPWQKTPIADRPSYEVDSQGYEVEYRLLYTAPPLASEAKEPK